MKEEALSLAAGFDDPVRRLNVLREYVQAFVLRVLHEQEAFSSIAFVGGTALRFLENLPRYSEDLDFSTHDPGGYRPESWLKKIKTELGLAGFDCAVTWNGRKPVNVAWVRLASLREEAGLSHRAEHKLSVKLEIDTNPPAGARLVRAVVRRHMVFALCHHDLPSLMAGKVRALLTRSYPKGRDWFDLMWYRAHRPPIEPNLDLLRNALDQTPGEDRVDAGRWRDLLVERLAGIDTTELLRDVGPFLERPRDRAHFTREHLLDALAIE